MAKATVYMRTANGEVFGTHFPEYHPECENLGSGQKAYAARQEYARSVLRGMVKPGQKVYTVLRRVSASGMSRDISLFIVQKGEMRSIDGLVSDACGISEARKGPGLNMPGCGMDMGFSIVYSLGAVLWPTGTRKPHGTRNGAPDRSGGYALKHEWL